MRRWIALSTTALVLIAAGIVVLSLKPKASPEFVTAAVARQTLTETVTATGTVNPRNTILVGSEVSGTVQTIIADYNDYVRQGQVLAKLDPTLFEEELAQAQGTLAQSEGEYQADLAALVSAQTNVPKDQAALHLAQLTVSRDSALLRDGYVAQNQYDSDYSSLVAAKTTLDGAIAAVKQAEKTVGAAQDAVAAAQASAHQAQFNLSQTIIRSPTNGTVIQRNVSIGETVASSFQTPTLYTLGQDLSLMEIDLNVGEPDVGNVHVGDHVDFSVLAYPNYVFHGIVAQVRENPTTVENVVTYDTVVYENNRDGRLRPGMTPTASIDVASAKNALVVPLSALNFAAAAKHVAGAAPHATPASPWGETGNVEGAAYVAGSTGSVIVIEKGKEYLIAIRVILVSGGRAAVTPTGSSRLQPGDQVAIAVRR